MNKTEQAKLELARKMLKGQIDVEEVAMISGVALTKVQELREELDAQERRSLGGVTVREMGYDVMIDNDILDERNVETDELSGEHP
ncbi:MAG: hypothetical protein NC089_12175 [Bacteroides sp.]|nr:hypothetical protein [Bacteroides sp.]MCM1550699.1 hypothetical protein [Clostridium sp.]